MKATLALKALAFFLVGAAMVALLLFLPAGTLAYPGAWRLMGLLFVPMLLFAVVLSFFFRDRTDFWCIKARGTVLGIVLIPVLFYTYNGAIGKSPDWLNIVIFFVAAATAYLYEARLFAADTPCWGSKKRALFLLSLLALLFVVFTFAPPTLGIFQDPLTGGYGVLPPKP